jgi:DNA-binding MurR/RpiR family transcriptional regulator
MGPTDARVVNGRATVLARIGTLAPSLRESERKIADYVRANPAATIHRSIGDLADATGTSEATVIRFAQRLGYAGYAAFKIELALELQRHGATGDEDLGAASDVATVKRRVLRANVESLDDTLQLLDDATLEQAVDALVAARRIEVYGVGSSAALAHDAYALLMQLGLPIVAVVDPHLQVMSAVQLGPGDVAFAISASGSSRDTVEALQLAREAGATCICLTRYARSMITRVADVTLLAPARPATVGVHQLIGRVAQLAVIDVLAAAIAVKRQDQSRAALDRGRQAISTRKRY